MSRLAQYRQAARENHTTKSTKHEEQEEDDGLNAETAEHAEMRLVAREAGCRALSPFRAFRGFVSFVATVAIEQRSVFAHGSTSSPRADVSRAPDMSLPALPQRDRQVTPGVGGVGIERQRFAKLRNRLVELASGSERDAQRVVQVSRLGNDRAEVGAACNHTWRSSGETAEAGHLDRRRFVRVIEQSEIRVEPRDERRRLAIDEALRAPRRNLGQIDDGRRHRFAEVQEGSDAVFLQRPVIADGRRIAARLAERMPRANERTKALPHGSRVEPLQ